MSKQPDWFLDVVIGVASQGDTEQGVVLYLPGMIVAGRLISQRRFFERLSEIAQDRHGWREMAETVSEFERNDQERVKAIVDTVNKEDREPTPEERDEFDRLQRVRIHLEDVTILGIGQVQINTPLWRGDLHDVMGWTLGDVPS